MVELVAEAAHAERRCGSSALAAHAIGAQSRLAGRRRHHRRRHLRAHRARRRRQRRPAVTLSFLLGAVACFFAGLCYAEMSSTVPITGSAYTYAYATLGELVAWIIGWDLILEYAVGAVSGRDRLVRPMS